MGYRSYALVTTVHVGGAAVHVTVYYSPPVPGTSYVTFVQSGLPWNVSWTVQLSSAVSPPNSGGRGIYGPGPTHTLAGSNDGVLNGTFAWTATLTNITYFPGFMYYPIPSQGEVIVNGSSVLIHLSFRYSYPFSFQFVGLSTSTSWSLQILNETFTGSGGTTSSRLSSPAWHLRVERHRARIPCSERHRHGAGHRRDPVPRGPVSSASYGVRRPVLGVECPGSWDRRDRGRRSSPSDTSAPTGPGLTPSSAPRVKPAFLSGCSERSHRGSLRPAHNTGRAPETGPGVPPGWRCSRREFPRRT